MTSTEGVGALCPDQNQLSVPHTDPGVWNGTINNLTVLPMSNAQQMGQDSMCGFEGGLGLLAPMMMSGMGLVTGPPSVLDLPVVKEIIHCSSCTLFPQNPNLPPPSTRERPPGCKTVFVGGLPENATQELIEEVFSGCGEILAIRKSKKNFCHLRFSEEFMVDKAMYLSGYRMRIGSSTDKKDSGRIHVDFAQARDDQYEWECKQRLMAREQRHRHSVQELYLHPPSPPAVAHYTEHEATMLADRLKEDHQISEASSVLSTWIDRGEVNRRTANQFYTMIQLVNSHVRRLLSEKAQQEEELERARDSFKHALLDILNQFEQISAVFSAATRQKSWDHFSKAQRKNIDIWRKQCEELRSAHSEEITCIRREEEMEMSDDDEPSPTKRMRADEGLSDHTLVSLKEENDSLRCQLDAYRNEVDLLRREQNKSSLEEELAQTHTPDAPLQHNWGILQQELLSLQARLNTRENELEEAREEQRYLQEELLGLRDRLLKTNGTTEGPNIDTVQGVNGSIPVLQYGKERRSDVIRRGGVMSEKEALLLGVVSIFLHVHPFGANLEYLWSYMQRLDSMVSARQLECLLLRLPTMFRQELSGVGANLEKRWKFCGFQSLSTG